MRRIKFDFYLGLPGVYFYDLSVVEVPQRQQTAQKVNCPSSHEQQSICRCVNARTRTLAVLKMNLCIVIILPISHVGNTHDGMTVKT